MTAITAQRGRFQSTLPVGEATMSFACSAIFSCNFNPRFPWGKRLVLLVWSRCAMAISIHASRGGSDSMFTRFPMKIGMISIHASRGGSDPSERYATKNTKGFQSTLPVGEATSAVADATAWGILFQSTLPVGEATASIIGNGVYDGISIHASRGGSDPIINQVAVAGTSDFNPRFPWGKRPTLATGCR